jgi:hypothetical protein
MYFEPKKRAYHLQVRDYLDNISEHVDRQSCTETLGAAIPRLDTVRLLSLRLH